MLRAAPGRVLGLQRDARARVGMVIAGVQAAGKPEEQHYAASPGRRGPRGLLSGGQRGTDDGRESPANVASDARWLTG